MMISTSLKIWNRKMSDDNQIFEIMRLNYSFYIFFTFAILFLQCRQSPKQFTLIPAEESGLHFRNDLTETQHNNIMTYEYSYNGGGVAVGDVNDDGFADVYFSGNSVPNKLFVNKGNWRFEDITEDSKTAGREDWKTGVTMADVNGDGWLDIYVCYSGNADDEGYERPVIRDHPKRSNQLFINNGCEPGGTPVFTESAKAYGLDAPGTFSTQSYFLDYDLDGDLDMFLLNHANMFYSAFLNTRKLRNLRHPYFGNKLYENISTGEGDPVFKEVSAETGIHGSGLNFGLSASISDFNNDRYPDIYVTNDYEEQDFCYINNGDGTFKEVSKKIFGHLSKYAMGSDIADINNDGFQDVIVLDMLPEDNRRQKLLKGPDEYDRYNLAVDSGYHHQYMRNTLQLNRGYAADSLPRFSEIGQLAGISNTDWSWAPLAADFDNDGLKDLFVTNGFLRDFNNLDFIKYTASAYGEARSARRSIDYLSLIQDLPSTKLVNYIFKNQNGLRFADVTKDWGLDQPSVSNGAVYADLDNDGDYDLITNNLNDGAFLYRNNQDRLQKNNYIKIKLKGNGRNTAGLGAKVWISLPDSQLFHEAWFNRGYQSSVEPVITAGIGNPTVVEEVKVLWPDGSESILTNVAPNTTVTVSQEDAQPAGHIKPMPNPAILREITVSSGLDFTHRENNFIDFKVQRLLYYQVSRLGGKFAKGDVNNDGNDDVFFGGAAGQPGVLFLGQNDGTFQKSLSQPWAADSISEDTHALFFDADSDGDQDLYVVSGGSEFVSSAPMYQDRLYRNTGNGLFVKSPKAIPVESSSGSWVTAADFDKDGDEDLFVGGRLVPGNYGYIPRSFLLRNDSGKEGVKFTDITLEQGDILSSPGMVTCAQWSDYNGDTWPDLIVTGEWMPIKIFENQKGKLVNRKDISALEKSEGWWCSIFPVDIDRDGDTDYFFGNAGTNMQFKASHGEPVQLFAWDFNQDGVLDPLLNYYIQGKSYPLASRDELLDQVSSLRKKFIKYEDYASATMIDIASGDQLESAHKFNAYVLESSWLENIDGKGFNLHSLPELAQLSSINGFIYDDFTGDERKEVIAAGNFYPFKPQLGRSDASKGIVLNYDNGVKAVDGVLSGLWLDGDIRHIDLLNFQSGVKRILVSRNNDKTSVYSVVSNGTEKMVVSSH
ncbi:MAG: VCBS repeat-containing protein [Cyclobacteriaceae bacterium]